MNDIEYINIVINKMTEEINNSGYFKNGNKKKWVEYIENDIQTMINRKNELGEKIKRLNNHSDENSVYKEIPYELLTIFEKNKIKQKEMFDYFN